MYVVRHTSALYVLCVDSMIYVRAPTGAIARVKRAGEREADDGRLVERDAEHRKKE